MPRPPEAAPALIYEEDDVIYLDGEEFDPEAAGPGGGVTTAADAAARLALTGLTIGARVYQTDNGFFYELRDVENPDDAASWKPTPKVYRATLSQTGTDAPTAVEAENDIGEIVYTRTDVGAYSGTLAAAFPANKTFLSIENNSLSAIVGIIAGRVSANAFAIETTEDGSGADEFLLNTTIEILVYP